MLDWWNGPLYLYALLFSLKFLDPVLSLSLAYSSRPYFLSIIFEATGLSLQLDLNWLALAGANGTRKYDCVYLFNLLSCRTLDVEECNCARPPYLHSCRSSRFCMLKRNSLFALSSLFRASSIDSSICDSGLRSNIGKLKGGPCWIQGPNLQRNVGRKDARRTCCQSKLHGYHFAITLLARSRCRLLDADAYIVLSHGYCSDKNPFTVYANDWTNAKFFLKPR